MGKGWQGLFSGVLLVLFFFLVVLNCFVLACLGFDWFISLIYWFFHDSRYFAQIVIGLLKFLLVPLSLTGRGRREGGWQGVFSLVLFVFL